MQDSTNKLRHVRLDQPGGGHAESWLLVRAREVAQEQVFAAPDGASGSGRNKWRKCEVQACLGEVVHGHEHCLAHINYSTRFNLLHLGGFPGGSISLRGVQVTQELWDQIANSPVFRGNEVAPPIYFDGAEVAAQIQCKGTTFKSGLTFSGARIYKNLEFRECKFESALAFQFAHIDQAVMHCWRCGFLGDLSLSNVLSKENPASFTESVFSGSLNADGFVGSINFDRATFRKDFSAKRSRCGIYAQKLVAEGSIELDHSECEHFIARGMQAKSANRLFSHQVRRLDLSESVFESRVRISTNAERVTLDRASLRGGGIVEIGSTEGSSERPEIGLEQLRLGGPLRVTGKSGAVKLPEILTLRNADAGSLTFSRVFLGRCLFYGAHDLQKIGLESTVEFARAPWWAGGRRYIADELAWRMRSKFHSLGWEFDRQYVSDTPARRKPGDPLKVQIPPLEAAQVASAYRELRCGFEAKSDMSGAADFYYGEMEMRRWSGNRGIGERTLVFFYWLLAGYGMRAGRALLLWVTAVLLGGYLMGIYGYKDGTPTVEESLLFALRATIPGVRTEGTLTSEGSLIEAVLRVVGPLSLALFAVAVRTRLMRKPSEA